MIMVCSLLGGLYYTVRCFMLEGLVEKRRHVLHGVIGSVSIGLVCALFGFSLYAVSLIRKQAPANVGPAKTEGYAEMYKGTDSKFCLRLPDGFKTSEVGKGNPSVLCSYEREGIIVFCCELDGCLDQKTDITKMVQNKAYKTANIDWNGFPISCISVLEDIPDLGKCLTTNIQFPTYPKSVQVSVFSKLEREKDIDGTVQDIVNGASGVTNWIKK
ncbi:MAG: hypothetical protein JXR97_04285 [Planctomycetes bacterium]|nr:hypothetical protein [Planctomycetota bacterium]